MVITPQEFPSLFFSQQIIFLWGGGYGTGLFLTTVRYSPWSPSSMEEDFPIRVSMLDRHRDFFLYINLEVYEALSTRIQQQVQKIPSVQNSFSNPLVSHLHECFGLIISY